MIERQNDKDRTYRVFLLLARRKKLPQRSRL
jgi:hypothetical protein